MDKILSYFSEMFVKLWENGDIQRGIWETIYLTLLSALIAYIIGLPLGLLLSVTDEGGIRPIKWLNKTLSIIVNVFRSMPFIILMVAHSDGEPIAYSILRSAQTVIGIFIAWLINVKLFPYPGKKKKAEQGQG